MNTFDVTLTDNKNRVVNEYHGDSGLQALYCYNISFRQLLTQQNMKTIETKINGEVISRNFDLIVQDFYL